MYRSLPIFLFKNFFILDIEKSFGQILCCIMTAKAVRPHPLRRNTMYGTKYDGKLSILQLQSSINIIIQIAHDILIFL